MKIQNPILFPPRNSSADAIRRCLDLVAAVLLVTLLSACAPVQVGNDQCKDVDVNLVPLKDAKYQTLPESAGGLSVAMRAAVDQTVQNFMASKQVPIAGCAIAITRNNQIQLQQTRSLARPNWTDVTNAPVVVGDEKQITTRLKGGDRFYRLHKP
jgi:hypothetical protein